MLSEIDKKNTTDKIKKDKEVIEKCWKNELLWLNKNLKFKMCLPNDYIWYDAYWHNLGSINKKHNTFLIIDNKWKKINSDESVYNIGLPWGWYRNDWYFSEIYFNWCFWKKSKKYLLWKLKVFDCLKSETDEYKSTIFIAIIHNKKVNFNFNKNNKEHIKIINSIKLLTEK
jgi:hypothetical protein